MQGKRRHQSVARRPLILDVLPPDIAPRLDVLPGPFYRRLLRRFPRGLRHWWLLFVLGFVLFAGAIVIWRIYPTTLPQIPKSMSSQIGDFVPYYFSKTAPAGISVKSGSITYSDGVLFFQAQDANGNNIVISEQALPAAFAHQQPQGDQKVPGVGGEAAVSNRSGRTIGSFITDKQPATLISLNASSAVSLDVAQTLLQALRPVSSE